MAAIGCESCGEPIGSPHAPDCIYIGTVVPADPDNFDLMPEEATRMPENDNRFKRAARYNDAQAEDHGLIGVCDHLGIDPSELLYISQQRALRLVLTESGRGAELSRITASNRPTPVRLTDAEKTKINSATAAYMDGIALGWRAAKEGSN